MQSELQIREQDTALENEKANTIAQKNQQLAKDQQELLAKYQLLLQERGMQGSAPEHNMLSENKPLHAVHNAPASLCIEASAA